MVKYILLGVLAIFLLALIFSESFFNAVADLSSILFFMFALINMIVIGALLAMEIAKTINLQNTETELLNLEQEIYMLALQEEFEISFSKEAIELHSSLQAIRNKITELQESTHEEL